MLYNQKEEQVTKQSYDRCLAISIENPMGGIPTAKFVSEKIETLSDGSINQVRLNDLMVDMSDPNKAIPVLNPETGEAINTVTFGYLYAVLFSVWVQKVEEVKNVAAVEG